MCILVGSKLGSLAVRGDSLFIDNMQPFVSFYIAEQMLHVHVSEFSTLLSLLIATTATLAGTYILGFCFWQVAINCILILETLTLNNQ